MRRRLYEDLQKWKAGTRKPLVVYGARQVGKTYLLEQFGRHEFAAFHYINFERDPGASRLFEGSLAPKELLPLLELHLNTGINPHTDILMLDELQDCPRALTSLKYFAESMPELAVCCAGAYIGLVGGESSFPVGKVNTLTLYPMSFQEFLAESRPRLSEQYAAFLAGPRPLHPSVHEQLWSALLQYFYVGGMPEAVRQFVEAGELNADVCQQVSRIHQELLTGYGSDFAKHSGTVNAHHLHRVFDQVPRQLSRDADANAARFTFKDVVPKAERYRDLSGAIDWLKATGLVYSSGIVKEAALPLAAYTKESMFKLYLFDIGLLHAMLGLSAGDILSASYGSYKGYVAENFVAGELRSAGVTELYSWSGASAEVEFLAATDNLGIVPIEVKAGRNTRRAKSLQSYRSKYTPSVAVKCADHNYSWHREHHDSAGGALVNLPLYAAGAVTNEIRLVLAELLAE